MSHIDSIALQKISEDQALSSLILFKIAKNKILCYNSEILKILNYVRF